MDDRARCLIVDDDEATRRLATFTLEQRNVEIVDVATGAEALELIGNPTMPPFIMVLCDLNLQDTVSAAALLRAAADRQPRAKLVIMTAHLDRQVRARVAHEMEGIDVTLLDKFDIAHAAELLADARGQ